MRVLTMVAALFLLAACATSSQAGNGAAKASSGPAATADGAPCQSDWECGKGVCFDGACRK